MRRAAKVDANQSEVVKTLRSLGCSVHPTHMVGAGFPDLVVGIGGVNILVEVKDGSKVPSARKLTQDEIEWHTAWRGQVCIVESIEDAVELVNSIRRSRGEA